MTVYYRKKNLIYYSAKSSNIINENSDQLFSYNIKTNEHFQLTDDLYAINYIIPTSREVFMIAAPLGSRTVYPVSVMLQGDGPQQVQYYQWDDELTVSLLSFNPYINKIAISAYSEPEHSKRIIDQSDTNPYTPVTQTLFLYSFSDNLFVHKTDVGENFEQSLLLTQNSIHYVGKKTLENELIGESYKLNLDNDELDISVDLSSYYNKRYIGTNSNESIYYYIDDGRNALISINIDTGEEIIIYEATQESSIINNAILLKDY